MPSGTGEKWLTVVRLEDGTLEIINDDQLLDNGTLFTAVIVSIILASMLSIFGLISLFYVLYTAFTTFSKDSAHIGKYATKYNKDYLQQDKDQQQQLELYKPTEKKDLPPEREAKLKERQARLGRIL